MAGFAKNAIESYWLLAAECFIYDIEKALDENCILEDHPSLCSKYVKYGQIKNFAQDKRLPGNLRQRLEKLDLRLQDDANKDSKISWDRDIARADKVMKDMHDEWGNVATKQEYGAELVRRLFPNDIEAQKQVLAGFLGND